MERFTYCNLSIGVLRLTNDLLYVNPLDIPDSDICIIEDDRGYRYKRNIQLTYKANELPGFDGYIFERI